MLSLFQQGKKSEIFNKSLHGLERECLRVDHRGMLSQRPHPKALGSALTNPYITTDFCESQLELITPTFHHVDQASNFLKAIHCFINHENPHELIWPFSMPCRLPKDEKIPLAQYGDSTSGKKKTLYRKGLSERYGSKMQTVSGTHYNFSFSEEFWQLLYKKFARKNESLQDFTSESYLHLMRNFLRDSWINTYLFGAAPAIDKSYMPKKPKALKRHGWSTYYGPYATSLRMSNIGYYSKVQAQLTISYNSLPEYLEDLDKALNTAVPAYKNLAGLNDKVLQIENEHYSRIRAKQPTKYGEKVIDAIRERGVRYVEVRAVDINPYQPIGIAKHQIRFLHMLLIHELFQSSPKITADEAKIIRENQEKVAVYGRKPELKLQTLKGEKTLKELAGKILKNLEPIAEMLGKKYLDSLEMQKKKLENPDLLSSARILREMKEAKGSYIEHGLHLAQSNKKALTYCPKTHPGKKIILDSIAQSFKDQQDLEIREDAVLAGYEDLEISSQMLLKEAIKRKVNFEILDRQANFIRLKKGGKTELVQQATFTNHDSVISYWINSSKNVQKKLMAERGISVPAGEHFTNFAQAADSYVKFKDKKLVIKPTHANYGLGISFVEANSEKDYLKALEIAFEHDNTVIVEEFFSGKEYRFLIIGDKCSAIVHREPANITGDGQSTIAQLVAEKNANPLNYKFLKKFQIRLDKTERDFLKAQKLNTQSIPKKGQKIYLRENSNVSTGGDSIDYTDKIHVSYANLAVKAAQAGHSKICGVDMMIKDIKKPATPENYSVIEINYNPSLHIHGYTVSGKKRNVAADVIDFLGF